MTTRRLATLALVAPALLGAWLALAAAVAWLRDEARVVALIGPPSQGMAVLAATGQPVLAAGPWAVTTRVQDAQAVRRLYAAGAWLVVEGSAGCGWFSGTR